MFDVGQRVKRGYGARLMQPPSPGRVFALLMASLMLGSRMHAAARSLIYRWTRWSNVIIEATIAALTSTVAATALTFVPSVNPAWARIVMLCLFEVCCGLYFPVIVRFIAHYPIQISQKMLGFVYHASSNALCA